MLGACSMHVKVRNPYKILVENHKVGDHLRTSGVYGRIILKCSWYE